MRVYRPGLSGDGSGRFASCAWAGLADASSMQAASLAIILYIARFLRSAGARVWPSQSLMYALGFAYRKRLIVYERLSLILRVNRTLRDCIS
jgi:hypothetical protein